MDPLIIVIIAVAAGLAAWFAGMAVTAVRNSKGETKEFEEAKTEDPIPDITVSGLRAKRGYVAEKKIDVDKGGCYGGVSHSTLAYAVRIEATDGTEECIFVSKDKYTELEERQIVDFFTDDEGFVCFADDADDLHIMTLDDEPFELIRDGLKTIELRLYDEKRRLVKVGDKICFKKKNGDGDMTVNVTAIYRFPSFEELYKTLPLEKCGYSKKEAKSASPDDMRKYYTAEDEKKYGVVGIEVEL